MTFNTAFGSTLAISSATTTDATDTAGEFEALTFLPVNEIENAGEFGDQFQQVTFTSLSDGRVRKRKGTADAGDMQVVVAYDPSDAGQDQMRVAAADQSGLYAFRVRLNDGSSGSPSAPSTFYFTGLVMSERINVGDANNVVRQTFMIGIDSAIIPVAPV